MSFPLVCPTCHPKAGAGIDKSQNVVVSRRAHSVSCADVATSKAVLPALAARGVGGGVGGIRGREGGGEGGRGIFNVLSYSIHVRITIWGEGGGTPEMGKGGERGGGGGIFRELYTTIPTCEH